MDGNENSYHFQVIARAIAEIDAAGGGPLSLDALARRMNMSPAHFQRLFSAWVGVSPKRYQQYLTLGHAKRLMAERFTTLEAAQALGLSGSSRLHDLFLRWEAMTPGEFARAGEETEIFWGWFDSPFGLALAMGTRRGLCGLAFAAETGTETVMEEMVGRWPKAQFTEDPVALAEDVEAAFTRRGEARMTMVGGPFQIKVWEALLSIPEAQVTTYGEIAAAIGHPGAHRAVGTAVGRNPLAWLIPCHRALRKSGALGGYHWGLNVKRAMLAWEAAREDSRFETV